MFLRQHLEQQRGQGGFEKTPDTWSTCTNREHSPPSMLHVPAGYRYRHVCPECGQQSVVQVPQFVC